MAIPARDEINVYDSLDERVACDHFLGKSLEQAEALFREISLYYQEDLMWMGPTAFRFYVQSYINYLQNDSAADDIDIRCFASILEHRMGVEAAELIAIAPLLAIACRAITNRYDEYSIKPETDDDLILQFELLEQRIRNLA